MGSAPPSVPVLAAAAWPSAQDLGGSRSEKSAVAAVRNWGDDGTGGATKPSRTPIADASPVRRRRAQPRLSRPAPAG